MNISRNKTKKIIIAGAIALGTLMNCARETFIPTPLNEGKIRDVVFSINVPGKSDPVTRALGDVEENAVKSIEMLIFNPQTKSVVHNPVFADVITTDPDGNGDFRRKSFLVRLPEGTYDVMIFANSRAAFNSVTIQAGEQQESILAKLTASMPSTGWVIDNNDVAERYLIPMWGLKEGVSIGNGANISGIYLHRMVSRVDVKVTGADGQTGNFKLKDIKIYNVQKEGRIAPSLLNWNKTGVVNESIIAGLVTAPSLTGIGVFSHPVSYASAIANDQKSCVSSIYIFEAPKAMAHADQNAPYLTIKGEFNGVDGWYRIDFADYSTMNYLDVLRNHLYSIGINKVTGTGFPDEEDAKKNRGDNIVVDITLWNEYDLGGVWFDGQHFIAISPQDINYDENTHTGETLTIRTDNDLPMTLGNFKVSGSGNNPNVGISWIKNLSLTPGGIVNGKYVYTLTYDVEENNDLPRTGYIYVAYGRITAVVRIAQAEGGTTTIFFDPENVFLYYNTLTSAVVVTPRKSSGTINPNTNWTLSVPSAAQSWLKISLDAGMNYASALTSVSGTGEETVYLYLNGVYDGNTPRSTIFDLDNQPSTCEVLQTPNPDYIENDGTPPVGVTTYVGAFWKASQTGERIIRIAGMYDADVHNRGPWYVSAVWYDPRWNANNQDGIVFSTSKLSVGALEARGISFTSDMTPEDAESVNSQITNGAASASGVVDANHKDIVFRIGLQQPFGKYSNSPDYQTTFPVRYAVVQIVYGNNPVKIQRLFIRQGEGDDKIFGDVRGSAYNLGNSDDRNYYGNGGFVAYPTQAGYFYQWGYSTSSSVPHPFHPTYPVSGLPAGWTQGTGTLSYALANACPNGYIVPPGEAMQTLFAQNSHSFWGYYADGFFDRRRIQNGVTANKESTQYGVNSAVSSSNDYAAYIGNLFFNPATNATNFFPAAGYRNGELWRTGNDGMYVSSSTYSGNSGQAVFLNFWPSSSTQSGANIADYSKVTGFSVRCIKDPNN